MNCHDAKDRFSDLRDGQLSGGELVELEGHLARCPACRQEWAEFQNALGALHGMGAVEPRSGFAARVRAQIEAVPWNRRVARWLFVPWQIKLPLEAAALVLLAVATMLVYERSPEMRQVVERPEMRQAPKPSQPEPLKTVPRKEPTGRTARGARPQPQVKPLTGDPQGARAADVAARPKADLEGSVRATTSAPTAAGQAAERVKSGEAAPLQAAHSPARAALSPFRIMSLRTQDVAAAEKRIREWTRQAGGRLVDTRATAESAPPGPVTLSIVVPVQAVPRLDALLAELGQLFGKELEVPVSSEVLISLIISPKLPPPTGEAEN